MVVVTYDEFGGQWDHVSPPGQGGAPGPHDKWGPGTRIPALIIAPGHRERSSPSITRSTTRRRSSRRSSTAGACSRSSSRDAAVNDLAGVFSAKPVGDSGRRSDEDAGAAGRPPLLVRSRRADPARLSDVSGADGARSRHVRRSGRAASSSTAATRSIARCSIRVRAASCATSSLPGARCARGGRTSCTRTFSSRAV